MVLTGMLLSSFVRYECDMPSPAAPRQKEPHEEEAQRLASPVRHCATFGYFKHQSIRQGKVGPRNLILEHPTIWVNSLNSEVVGNPKRKQVCWLIPQLKGFPCSYQKSTFVRDAVGIHRARKPPKRSRRKVATSRPDQLNLISPLLACGFWKLRPP